MSKCAYNICKGVMAIELISYLQCVYIYILRAVKIHIN